MEHVVDLKVSKRKVPLTINLAGGERISGYIFFGSQSVLRYSEELISDLSNDHPAFSPFEMESPSTIRIINKKNIIFLSTAEDLGTEKKRGKKKRVNVVLVNGQAFTGNLIIDQPEHRARVLDGCF
jgi:hypothetical protein